VGGVASELHAASALASIEKSANELEKEGYRRFIEAATVTRELHLCQHSVSNPGPKIFATSPKSGVARERARRASAVELERVVSFVDPRAARSSHNRTPVERRYP
jgi:hypothetical protein